MRESMTMTTTKWRATLIKLRFYLFEMKYTNNMEYWSMQKQILLSDFRHSFSFISASSNEFYENSFWEWPSVHSENDILKIILRKGSEPGMIVKFPISFIFVWCWVLNGLWAYYSAISNAKDCGMSSVEQCHGL